MNAIEPQIGPRLRALPIKDLQFDFIKHRGAWSVFIYRKGLDDWQSVGGTAMTRELAIQKALSEFVERSAFFNCMGQHVETFPNSTGFAARPWTSELRFLTRLKTRASSYLEASERYLAYRWWEDYSSGMRVKSISKNEIIAELPTLSRLDCELTFTKVCIVEISTSGWEDVILLIGFLPGRGIITGCAAGWAWQRPETIFRASVELIRNHRIFTNQSATHSQTSRYIEKLLFLASGAMDSKVNFRLNCKGRNKTKKPKLVVDESVNHEFEETYYVHRCVLANQPDNLASNENIVF